MAGLADLLQWQGMGADQQPMQQPQQAPTSLAESITPDILAKLMEYIQGSVPQYQDDPQRPTDMQSLLISMGAGLMGADDFGTGMSQGMSSFMQNRNILDQAQRGQNTERGMGTALGNYRAASALESLMGGSSSGKQPPDYAAFSESLKIDYPEFAQEIDAAVSSGDEVLIRGLRKHLANASGETDADAHDKFVREQEYKAANSDATTYKPDKAVHDGQQGYISDGEFSALPEGTEFFSPRQEDTDVDKLMEMLKLIALENKTLGDVFPEDAKYTLDNTWGLFLWWRDKFFGSGENTKSHKRTSCI